MACSKEEIERKRLAALHKIKSKLSQSQHNYYNVPSSSQQRVPSPIKNVSSNHSFHPYLRNERTSNKQSESPVPVIKVVSGTVYLVSEDRFEINPSEFCTPLINIFKTIPSKSYGKIISYCVTEFFIAFHYFKPLKTFS